MLIRAAHTLLFRTALVVTLLFLAVTAVLAVTGARLEPVLSGSMSPTIPRYSLVAAVPVRADSLRVGDVVIFQPPAGHLPAGTAVMHRVVELRDQDGTPVMRTRGDANTATDPWTVDLRSASLYRVQTSLPHAGVVVQFLHNTASRTGGALTWPGILLLAGAAAYATRLLRNREPRAAVAPLQQISYELRTPLSSIVGYTELLADEQLSPRQAEVVRTIARQAQRLTGLADDLSLLQTLTRDPEHVDGPTCLLAILHQVRDALAPHLAAHGADLVFDVEGDTGVLVDPRPVRRAVTALLDEAVTSAEPGHILTITVRRRRDHVTVDMAELGAAHADMHAGVSVAATTARHLLQTQRIHVDAAAAGLTLRLPVAA
ncbi:signal peptidase I [Dactylosporangium aurantiacum]|uniref:Signal peptidase I n=1 Tax=Dactylosporangium aurantiacum TaxID=35754 RepID=A0A9Q9IR34_9ACTN|nr:signal peptidase I [Dactylosporangium aurantiacum]MDG6110023.1 signal peptidase I [Dactylosporangium aurantiacum]UWZ58415.1 signal peptidase I [Dactylosporangium aurantiacum]